MKSRIIVSGVIATALSLGGGQSALAAAVNSPDGGARASNVGLQLTIKDTKADGHSVYTNYNPGGGRLENFNGNGTSLSVNLGSLTSFRACTNIGGGPDSCSSYVSP